MTPLPHEFTDHDQALVDIQCHIQLCESQIEFDRFKAAYADAKVAAFHFAGNFAELRPHNVSAYINQWGRIIDSRNSEGYRRQPVYIGGEVRDNQDHIPGQMEMFCDSFTDWYNDPDRDESNRAMKLSPRTLYEWFERIHPFIDGNGRTGHLVWAFAMTRKNGVWPRTLPPNVFDDPRLRGHVYVDGEHSRAHDIRTDIWDWDEGRWIIG